MLWINIKVIVFVFFGAGFVNAESVSDYYSKDNKLDVDFDAPVASTREGKCKYGRTLE